MQRILLPIFATLLAIVNAPAWAADEALAERTAAPFVVAGAQERGPSLPGRASSSLSRASHDPFCRLAMGLQPRASLCSYLMATPTMQRPLVLTLTRTVRSRTLGVTCQTP